MSLDNSTVPNPQTTQVNAMALHLALYYNAGLQAGPVFIVPELVLSCLLFGILTTLSAASVYFLVRQESSSVRLLLTTLLLYMSTGIYMIAFIWHWFSVNRLISTAMDRLFSSSFDGLEERAVFQHAVRIQSWMATVTIVINIIIGDAIVWWRACVIWRNKGVNYVGPLLLTLTGVFVAVGLHASGSSQFTGLTLFMGGNVYATVAVLLSITTNAIATSLIGYQAWQHRRLLKESFGADGTKTRVLKALALLVESGAVYCALLVVVLAYQIITSGEIPSSGTRLLFCQVATYFTCGCLVHLVAIYPTIIIVLVALQRSPIDTGGLSRVGQARGPGAGGTTGTRIFHHSTSHSSATEDTLPASYGVHSFESLANEGHTKAMGAQN